MPQQIDQDKINEVKILDIAKPPMKSIPFAEFPKMLFKHPADKTKEHTTKIVNSKDEQEKAIKAGYQLKAHVPHSSEESAEAAS